MNPTPLQMKDRFLLIVQTDGIPLGIRLNEQGQAFRHIALVWPKTFSGI